MRRIYVILLGILFPTVIWAQDNGLNVTLPPGINPNPDLTLIKRYEIDEFVGTWQYVGNDTVFTLKLVIGKIVGSTYTNELPTPLFGGYSLKVKGAIKANFIENIGTVWHSLQNEAPMENIYLTALTTKYPTHSLGTRFYDQRKKHLNGTGILGGYIAMEAEGKLHWHLDERIGIDAMCEGDPDIEYPKLIGFSVPTDVIMTKISDE